MNTPVKLTTGNQNQNGSANFNAGLLHCLCLD